MRRIVATLAVVGALMFSAAGPASADFLSDVLSDTGLSKEATFNGVYCKGTGGAYKRDLSCKYGDKKISKESYDRLTDKASDTANKIKEPKAAVPKLEVLNASYVALKNANVRDRPDVKSPRVATLSKGSVITALGKVKGKNWYAVARGGKHLGYVWAGLLKPYEDEFASISEVMAAEQSGDVARQNDLTGEKEHLPTKPPLASKTVDEAAQSIAAQNTPETSIPPLSLEDEIAKALRIIGNLEDELRENRALMSAKIDDLKHNPLFNPERDPFESDSDFVARTTQIRPILAKLKKQYLGDIQQRLNAEYDREFVDNNADITLGDYDPNNEIWNPITARSTHSEGYSASFRMKKSDARHLHNNFEHYQKIVFLTIDSDKKVRPTRVVLKDSASGRKHEYTTPKVWKGWQKLSSSGHTSASPSGRFIASTGGGVFDTEAGKSIIDRPLGGEVVVFSSDSQAVAYGTDDIYNCGIEISSVSEPGKFLKYFITEFGYSASRLAFSPDGELLSVSCSSNYSHKPDINLVLNARTGLLTAAGPEQARAILSAAKRYDHPRYAWTSNGIVRKKRETTTDVAAAPLMPPALTAELSFTEPSGNRALDAGETAILTVSVANSGAGDADGVMFRIEPETIPNLAYIAKAVGRVPAGGSVQVEIPIEAYLDAESATRELTVKFTEANGFPPDPVQLSFNVRSWDRPALEITDIGIDEPSGNGRIDPAEVVTLTVRVHNNGEGVAKGAYAKFYTGRDTFIAGSATVNRALGDLKPGEFKDVSVEIFTNKDASEVQVFADLTEATNKASNSGVRLPIELNRPVQRITKLVIEEKKGTGLRPSTEASLSVDVETNIPSGASDPDALAVVIGIERYQNIARASFAERDATFMLEYFKKVFGISPTRSLFLINEKATKGSFDKAFNKGGWLDRRVREGRSDVYIYFSGHGSAELEGGEKYLIPFDGDPNYPVQTGASLELLYKRASELGARSVTIFLDSCFSGTDRENNSLLADTRSIMITPKEAKTFDLTVYSATRNKQISSASPELKHGLFTYALLKGLQGSADSNNDSAITHKELSGYVHLQVPKFALHLDREQTPVWVGTKPNGLVVQLARDSAE